MPVQKATSSGFADHFFPGAHHLKLLVPVANFIKLTSREHISIDQVDALLDHCLAQGIVASFVALDNVHHELHHVVLHLSLLLLVHSVDLLHAALDLPHDELARVSVDQNDPLVDEELLCLELNLDRFEHFNGLNDDREGALGHGAVRLLEQ